MKRKTIIKLAILALAIALIIIFRDYLNVDAFLSLMESIRSNPFAPVVFVLIYSVSVTLIVPAVALTLLSVPLFGFWGGLLLTIIGSNIGCHLSYFIGKSLGEETINKFIKSGSFIEKAKKSATKNGFVFMMYARLIPLFPFAAVNYLSAIIGIKYKDYALATLIGMLPGSVVYIYLAYTATNISENPLGIIVSIAILVVFTLVLTLVKKRTDKKEQAEEKTSAIPTEKA